MKKQKAELKMKLEKNSKKVNEAKHDVLKITNPKSTFWSSDRDTTVPVNNQKSKPVIVLAGNSMVMDGCCHEQRT